MNLQEELSRFNPDPALAEWVLATLKNAEQTAFAAEQTSQTLHAELHTAQTLLHTTQTTLQIRDAELHAANIELHAANIELHNANIKIQSLTLELAQRRRMLFGRSHEGYAGEQLELFESSAQEDIAALS